MKAETQKIPDEEVVIKMSICPDCSGWVRQAVWHKMRTKDKTDFAKEVVKYNLSVKELPLAEYRQSKYAACAC